MKKTILGLSVLVALASTQAMAQDGTWYASGAIGQSECRYTNVCDFPGVDKKSTSVNAAVGYNFTKIVAVEAGYFDMGKSKFSGSNGNFDVKAQGPQISVIVSAPVADAFSFYGRLGFARTDRKGSYCVYAYGICGPFSDKKSEALYGVGLGYAFTNKLTGTLEYQKLDNSDVTSINIGVRLSF